jgi:hypothetical protein
LGLRFLRFILLRNKMRCLFPVLYSATTMIERNIKSQHIYFFSKKPNLQYMLWNIFNEDILCFGHLSCTNLGIHDKAPMRFFHLLIQYMKKIERHKIPISSVLNALHLCTGTLQCMWLYMQIPQFYRKYNPRGLDL